MIQLSYALKVASCNCLSATGDLNANYGQYSRKKVNLEDIIRFVGNKNSSNVDLGSITAVNLRRNKTRCNKEPVFQFAPEESYLLQENRRNC